MPKTARQRKQELARRKQERLERKSPTNNALDGKSRSEVTNLILQGDWCGQPCFDDDQRCLQNAVWIVIHARPSSSIDPPSNRLQAFHRLLKLFSKKHSKWITNREPMRIESGERTMSVLDILGLIASYQKLWIRSLETWRPRSKNAIKIIVSLINHLFVKYSVPTMLHQAWLLEDFANHVHKRKIFFHLAAGHSPRTAKFPIPYTKKMGHWFMQASSRLSFENAVRWAELKTFGFGKDRINAILLTQLGNQFENQDFWVTFFQWLLQHPSLPIRHIGPLVDFLHFQKFGGYLDDIFEHIDGQIPNLTMKGRTPESLIRQMNLWYAELDRYSRCRYSKVKWASSQISPLEYEVAGKEARVWTIAELTTAEELKSEGRAMDHCVYTYVPQCRLGQDSIWSMQFHDHRGTSKALTVQVKKKNREICQARGKSNRDPNPEEVQILRVWASRSGLKMDRLNL
ncbi:MAG: PcfJ domain-containing protein [Planctomycetota bacterium]